MFKGWTLTALKKLLCHVETKSFIGKQVILSEGQKANKFHIVLEGEIELYKHVIVKEPREIDAQQYKHEPKDKNFKALYHLMKHRESEVITKTNIISIRYIRVGKLFGIEDFLSSSPDRKYSYSAVVKSLNCKIISFNRETALPKLKAHDHTWN